MLATRWLGLMESRYGGRPVYDVHEVLRLLPAFGLVVVEGLDIGEAHAGDDTTLAALLLDQQARFWVLVHHLELHPRSFFGTGSLAAQISVGNLCEQVLVHRGASVR